ncbi:hypothetical protein LTR39_006098, partial [Cryomyces antarcticus]
MEDGLFSERAFTVIRDNVLGLGKHETLEPRKLAGSRAGRRRRRRKKKKKEKEKEKEK